MPGISIVRRFEPGIRPSGHTVKPAWDRMIHAPSYEQKTILNNESTFIGSTRHFLYPVSIFENETFLICIDGAIYGLDKTSLEKELFSLAADISNPDGYKDSFIANWLKKTDGEFVLSIMDRGTGKIFILNDLIGLLPCYYRLEKGRFLFAREVSFIADMAANLEFDRMSMAQHLIFDYTIGSNIFYKDIMRVPAATLISIGNRPESLEIKRIWQMNCEHEEYAGRSLNKNVDDMVDIFDTACKNRIIHAQGTKIILSMSGGRDSRAVCTGLFRAGAKFSGVTFYLDGYSNVQKDVQIAEEMARRYNVQWQLINLPVFTFKDACDLFNMKGSLNNLGMAFVIRFLKILKSGYDEPVTYATGDIGLSPWDMLPSRNLRNLDELTQYAIRHFGIMTPGQAAKLLNLRTEDIIEKIRSDLDASPEKDFNRKFINLYMEGRGFKWNHEGMDRNRFFFWLMVPQASPLFVYHTMKCPAEQKKGFRFNDEFLIRMSNKNKNLNLAEYNAPSVSIKAGFKRTIRSIYDDLPIQTRRMIKMKIMRNWSSFSLDSTPVECFSKIIDNCQIFSHYMNKNEVKKILTWCSKDQFNVLFSLACAMKRHDKESTSVFDGYGKSLFR